MTEQSKIKILIGYHRPSVLLESDIYEPIHLGRAVAMEASKDGVLSAQSKGWLLDNMIGDDTGDNISCLNRTYNELTGIYWAWKNYKILGDPEYVGFMHYRRHFMFDDWQGSEDALWLPGASMYAVPYITSKYMSHLRDELVVQRVTGQDCVVLKSYDVKNLGVGSVREQYCRLPGQRGEWFDILLATVRRLYPEYAVEVTMLENGSVQYLCNMFIMKRELFREYSEFCFRVLADIDRQVDSRTLNTSEKRFLGFLGEFCLTLYIFHAYAMHRQILELNGSYILSNKPLHFTKLRLFYYNIMRRITSGARHHRYICRCDRIRAFIAAENAIRK